MKRGTAALSKLVVSTVLTTFLVTGIWDTGSIAVAQSTAFEISSSPAMELNATGGGPATANLQQAAEFAWQEFFALSWPALPQSGQPNQRETPSTSCALGEQSPNCAGPLVWQTYRGKVEIFPGQGDPPGYSVTAPSYGYDALPVYKYEAQVDACPGVTPSSQSVWINLDETDEITLDSMYAGVVSAKPNAHNTAPQLIRFLAKANRIEYQYVAKNKLLDGRIVPNPKKMIKGNIIDDTINYIKTTKSAPTDVNKYVLLPNNSIEVKAGWRVLNPSEIKSGRFHTATVQYYELAPGTKTRCYEQATFGLVALHIIQKTPMAPYFIYATFEQADNILTESGKPVEDVDGAPTATQQACRSDQQHGCPTTPSVTLNDTNVKSPTGIPPRVVTVPDKAPYCTSSSDMRVTPPNRLFYLNTTELEGLPTGGYICINSRDNPIPRTIVDVNKRAHDLIRAYSSKHAIANSVWQYYKLLNVQYKPIDKKYAGPFKSGNGNAVDANSPGSYHLANIVVETNYPLQLFSGGLVGGTGGTGTNSDYASQFPFPGGSGNDIQPNMFFGTSPYNMGGCMGCHGGQGQIQGGDFSVIVARGRVKIPETPAPPTPEGAKKMSRNRSLRPI